MDHTTAVQTMAVEKYLLDEFSLEERDGFEEHFFSCDICAREIQAGAALMTHGKEIFDREREAQRAADRRLAQEIELDRERARQSAAAQAKRPKRQWFAALWPNFAVPAMALMLGVVVFQNLVQIPAMHESLVAMNAPAVLPNLYLASGGARGGERTVVAKPGAAFQLTIDIPGGKDAANAAELYDAEGRKLWSLPIPESAPKEGLALKMPGDLGPGTYSLVVRQAGSDSGEIGRYDFTLRRE